MPGEDSMPIGQDPGQAGTEHEHLTDLEIEYLAGIEAEERVNGMGAWAEDDDPDRERVVATVMADEAAQADNEGLYRELTHAVAAVAGHGAAGPADAGARAQDDGFADIWGAFSRLRESLGLPQAPGSAGTAGQPQGQVPSGPVSAALLEDAMAGARASAAWYRDSPEWERITLVTGAARALLDAIRRAAGDYWNEVSQDIRVRGFLQTVAARTCRAISACAGTLAARLERAGDRQTAAWRAMSLLHRTAGAAANRIIGYRPSVAEAEQIITALNRQRQAAARRPAAGGPAALAALSFPAPVSQATASAPAPAASRDAAAGMRRRPGGLRH